MRYLWSIVAGSRQVSKSSFTIRSYFRVNSVEFRAPVLDTRACTLKNLTSRSGSTNLNVGSPSGTDWQGAAPLPARQTRSRYFEFPAVTIGDVTPYSAAIWMPFFLI